MAELFAPKKKTDTASEPHIDVQKTVNQLNARLKMNEERFSELRKKMQFIEQSMISNQKKVNRELKTLVSDITDSKKVITDIKSKMGLIIKELQLSASKEDVDVLRKYLDLWQPVKFVTATQVEKIIEEKISR